MKVKPRPRRQGRPALLTRPQTPGEHGVSIDEALRRGNDVKTMRLQIVLNPDYNETLDELKAKTRVTTAADVVRGALDKYAQQLLCEKRGGYLVLDKSKGKSEAWPIRAEDDDVIDTQDQSGKSMRLQLLLHPEYAKTIDAMRRMTRAASYADVVRSALENYARLLSLKSPQRLIVVRANGDREILFDPEPWSDWN
jgi:hypothetical protein